MEKSTHSWLILGAVVLTVLFGNMLTGQGKAFAELYSFNLTFVGDTLRACHIGEQVQYKSILKNTGTQADTYYVTRTENPPTPTDWWADFCVGGICYDSNITVAKTYIVPGDSAEVLLDALPRTTGNGNWKITVQSTFNPSLSKYLYYYLTARPYGPVTNQWGLVILFLLILSSGMYLMLRRFKTVRQT